MNLAFLPRPATGLVLALAWMVTAAFAQSPAPGTPAAPPAEHKAIEVTREVLATYVGVYELRPGVNNTIRLAPDGLTTELTGRAALPLFAESETKFFLKAVNASVEFIREADGRVSALIMTQGERTRRIPRISDTVPSP